MTRISKWSLVLALALAAALPLASCEPAPSAESDLIRRFNIGAIVERVGARQFQGGTVAASYSNSPGETTKSERTINLEYRLDESGGKFDEQDFISRLDATVAEAMYEPGAGIIESVRTENGFAKKYTVGSDVRGSIEVVANRTAQDSYKIFGKLSETSRVESGGIHEGARIVQNHVQ